MRRSLQHFVALNLCQTFRRFAGNEDAKVVRFLYHAKFLGERKGAVRAWLAVLQETATRIDWLQRALVEDNILEVVPLDARKR